MTDKQDWHVYMLLCDQRTFYVGISDDPQKRLIEHRDKKSFFTKKFSDLQLVYCERYTNKHVAALREKQIKGWSRAKNQMLCEGKLGYNVCTELGEASVG
jgi:putative endonuclease